jgi:hypothetical protein
MDLPTVQSARQRQRKRRDIVRGKAQEKGKLIGRQASIFANRQRGITINRGKFIVTFD